MCLFLLRIYNNSALIYFYFLHTHNPHTHTHIKKKKRAIDTPPIAKSQLLVLSLQARRVVWAWNFVKMNMKC
jgi:hypothetical protein